MADPNITNKFLIMLGDGEASETFSWPCGARARSVTFTNNTGEEEVLDCSDPTGEQAAIERWVESQDTQMTISGRVDTTAFPTWRAWADDALVKNIQVHVQEALAQNGGYWSLPAILQQLEIGQEGKATTTFTATIVGAGRRSWTDAAS